MQSLKGLEKIDHGSFKAFLAAAKELNFTAAATKAAMTQSGISQHIAKLEEQLETQLFKRVNKKVFLTRAGEILLRFVEKQQDETSQLLEAIHGEVNQVTGIVRYGMPHSCLFTPHFPFILKKRNDFPKVNLEVQLCPNEEVFDKLLDQRIDFGFATGKINNPAVKYEPYCGEEYVLIGNKKEQLKSINKNNFFENNFVVYPGMDTLFEMWVKHYFKTSKMTFSSLKVTGKINSLHGAVTMVQHGVGLSIVPRHCADEMLKKNVIFEFSLPNRSQPLNEINIVTLKDIVQPKRVKTVLNAFWEMKAQPASISDLGFIRIDVR